MSTADQPTENELLTAFAEYCQIHSGHSFADVAAANALDVPVDEVRFFAELLEATECVKIKTTSNGWVIAPD